MQTVLLDLNPSSATISIHLHQLLLDHGPLGNKPKLVGFGKTNFFENIVPRVVNESLTKKSKPQNFPLTTLSLSVRQSLYRMTNLLHDAGAYDEDMMVIYLRKGSKPVSSPSSSPVTLRDEHVCVIARIYDTSYPALEPKIERDQWRN